MQDRRLFVLVLSFFPLVSIGCGKAGTDTAPQRLPNILLISLDACRASNISSYGYSRQTSPVIDDLASRGVRFSRAFVNTLGTTTSHTTILTSLYQETHQVEVGLRPGLPWDSIPEEAVMLQQILENSGYRTLAVTDGGRMSAKLGFNRGFAIYDDSGTGVADGTEKLLDHIRVSMDQHPDRPIFAFYHTYEIHSPYIPPPEYRDLFGTFESLIEPTSDVLKELNEDDSAELSKKDIDFLKSQYDGEIRYTDERLGSLIDALEALGFLDDFIIVITSDHGEEFGEHGGLMHRGLLYDELLHVPLIIVGTRVPSGMVVNQLAQAIDIAPTLLRYAGIEVPSEMEGRDLLALDEPSSDTVFAQFRDVRYAVRTSDWKLIETIRPRRETELYDLIGDPLEQRDVSATHQGVRRELQSALSTWIKTQTAMSDTRKKWPELEAKDVEDLRALGYIN